MTVVVPGHDDVLAGMQRERATWGSMTEVNYRLALPKVPELDDAVLAAGVQARSDAVEDNRSDVLCVAHQFRQ
eukprot:757174-Hanusia_phi.AAC.2